MPEETPTPQGAPETPARPDWLPEKFWTDQGPNVENLAKSYNELDSMRGNLKAKVQEEWNTERLAKRPPAPDKYELPKHDALDPEAMGSSPIVSWWRNFAYESGLPQEDFQKGITAYAEAETQRIDTIRTEEMGKLGENAKARTEAVGLWARKKFGDTPKYAAIAAVCSTAAGVEAIEELMRGAPADGTAFEATADQGDTEADIQRLMQEPTYWDSKRRDPKVVARVEAFFKKKYPT